jgi:chitin disaccharide deacetylase
VTERALIVNADDFGRSAAINTGILRCCESGIVTSATLMVRWPAAGEAARLARGTRLSVGLHLDLGEWEYRDGGWHPVYEVLEQQTPATVAAEIAAQLERFEHLVGAPPTHLDSHQHVHRDEPTRSALARAGEVLGVPVRERSPGIRYSGAFFGQDGRGTPVEDAITVAGLIKTIEELPPGVTELGCHPAAEAEGESMYDTERVREVETLCDPRVRAALQRGGVELRSFADLRTSRGRWSSVE